MIQIMANGPGKYDTVATIARETAQAKAVVLVVLGGNRGSGFSVQSQLDISPIQLAQLLEHTARQIRASMKRQSCNQATQTN